MVLHCYICMGVRVKKRNPICEAHSTRGGAGAGPHKVNKKTASDERKQKHKKKIVDDSEDEL